MRDVSEIPESWISYLRGVQEKFPNAVIAGGCMRDWFQYRTRGIKDIDIFLPGSTDVELTEYLVGSNNIVGVVCKNKYGNLSNDDLNAIYKIKSKIDGLDVEFIAVTCSKEFILDRFDFGICQIMYDGNKILYTDAFIKDAENKTFTLVRADNQDQFNRSIKRYNRLVDTKYPGYMLAVSEFWIYE